MKKKSSNGRAAIIFPGNLFTTPYLSRYTEILERKGIEYDIICWNAKGIKESSAAVQKICLDYPVSATSSPFRKAAGYFRFLRMARAALRKQNYERILLLTSVPAVCLYGAYQKRYRGKYLIDIRDYYKEHYRLYFSKEKKAIAYSALTVISSEGFRQFLPAHDYVVTHNINWIDSEIVRSFRKERKDGERCINLAFIGSMRFPEQDRAVIDFFANDRRFHLHFYGSGYGEHAKYCAEKKIENVTVTDWFPTEKTVELYGKADIVLNLYGNGTPVLDYALSNKLYYAAQLGKPILVCPKTYMEKITTAYGFGFVLDTEDAKIKPTPQYLPTGQVFLG